MGGSKSRISNSTLSNITYMRKTIRCSKCCIRLSSQYSITNWWLLNWWGMTYWCLTFSWSSTTCIYRLRLHGSCYTRCTRLSVSSINFLHLWHTLIYCVSIDPMPSGTCGPLTLLHSLTSLTCYPEAQWHPLSRWPVPTIAPTAPVDLLYLLTRCTNWCICYRGTDGRAASYALLVG